MDGLSGKNFSCGVVFPDNKAFRKLCFARCLIENMVTLFYQTAIDHVYFYEIEFAKLIIHYRKIPLPTYQYRRFFDLPKMGAKKAANLFRIYCFVCRGGAAVIQF